MGIRFKCHLCQAPLNVKNDLAQKRGVCPKCNGKFRIPIESQDYSLSLDSQASNTTNKMVSDLDSEVLATNPISEIQSKVAPALKTASTSSSEKPTSRKPTERKKMVQESSTIKSATNEIVQQEPIATEPAPLETEQLYFVRPPSGGEYGPADKATIELWISQRRITADTLMCKLGESQWKKARDVFVNRFVLN